MDSSDSKSALVIYSDSIAKLLKRRDVETLLDINSARYDPKMVSTKEYQSLFKEYYNVRKGDQFCKPYFELLRHHLEQKTKPPLKAILLDLYEKTKERHLSFSSKLLATLDDNEPIYDINVATQLCVPLGSLPAKGWVVEAEKRMDLLKHKLNAIISSSTWGQQEAAFDTAFPYAIHLSSLRKADLMIWASHVNLR